MHSRRGEARGKLSKGHRIVTTTPTNSSLLPTSKLFNQPAVKVDCISFLHFIESVGDWVGWGMIGGVGGGVVSLAYGIHFL
jgi:hypothetical protein